MTFYRSIARGRLARRSPWDRCQLDRLIEKKTTKTKPPPTRTEPVPEVRASKKNDIEIESAPSGRKRRKRNERKRHERDEVRPCSVESFDEAGGMRPIVIFSLYELTFNEWKRRSGISFFPRRRRRRSPVIRLPRPPRGGAGGRKRAITVLLLRFSTWK